MKKMEGEKVKVKDSYREEGKEMVRGQMSKKVKILNYFKCQK